MKYLIVDGDIAYQGIRDKYNEDPITPVDLALPADLVARLAEWVANYHEAAHRGFSDADLIEKLDQEGLSLRDQLASALPESKVEYFSAAKMEYGRI